jgi:gentisate 1,2-dioxygenase
MYSSKDFPSTRAAFTVEVPSKLHHPNVAASGAEERFSAERRHAVHVVDLPSKTMSMTVGGLEPGQSSNRHRHTYETLIYILEGQGYSVIEDRTVRWRAGDAIYVPVWAWHNHVNDSSTAACRYLACENMPLLQNLGQLALREEAP